MCAIYGGFKLIEDTYSKEFEIEVGEGTRPIELDIYGTVRSSFAFVRSTVRTIAQKRG